AHAAADDKRRSTSAVVGTTTIVVDPTTKLGKDQNRDIVGFVVFMKVGVERRDRVGSVPQQAGVDLGLHGVGVEASKLRVEDPCAKASEMDLGNVAQVAGERILDWVVCGGAVRLGGLVEDVGAVLRINPCLTDESADVVLVRAFSVHAAQQVQR